MTVTDDPARLARQLLAGRLHGVLSTHSLEHPGFPFGTLVPYVLGQDGLPVLLLSHLSQHTRNIDADARCGLVVIAGGDGDVQQLGRLGSVGEAHAETDCADAERYFRYYPAARTYHDELSFRFYRYRPLRFHWNGGFAKARWFGNDRIVRANPLAPDVQTRIIDHMNADHRDALSTYLRDDPRHLPGDPVEIVGIDAEGIDLRAGDTLARVALPEPIGDADQAKAALVAMAG